jgi:hypothetical protein
MKQILAAILLAFLLTSCTNKTVLDGAKQDADGSVTLAGEVTPTALSGDSTQAAD